MQSRRSSKSSYGSGKGKGKGKGMRWQKVAPSTTPATAPAMLSSKFEMRPDAPIFVNISGKTKDQLYYLAGQMAAETMMYHVYGADAYYAAQQALLHQYDPYSGYLEGQYYQQSLQQSAHYQQDYGAAAGYSQYGAYAPAGLQWKRGSTMPNKVRAKAEVPPRQGQGQGTRQKEKLPLPAGAISTASTTPAASPSLNPAAAPFLPATAVLEEPCHGGADTAAGSTPSASAVEPEVIAEAAPTEQVAPVEGVPDAPREVPPSTSGIPAAVEETLVPSDAPNVVAFLDSEEDHAADGIEVKDSEPGKLALWAATKAAFGRHRNQLLLMGLAAAEVRLPGNKPEPALSGYGPRA